jgi:hypothetical protein
MLTILSHLVARLNTFIFSTNTPFGTMPGFLIIGTWMSGSQNFYITILQASYNIPALSHHPSMPQVLRSVHLRRYKEDFYFGTKTKLSTAFLKGLIFYSCLFTSRLLWWSTVTPQTSLGNISMKLPCIPIHIPITIHLSDWHDLHPS